MITRGLLYKGGLFASASTPLAPAETELRSDVADMKIYALKRAGLIQFSRGWSFSEPELQDAQRARRAFMACNNRPALRRLGTGWLRRRGKAGFTHVDENGMWIRVSSSL
jgi:hypothetical protein